MVRILRKGVLRTESIVASVVVLPLPVGPVMTIMPCGRSMSRLILRSSSARQSELRHIKQAAISRQQIE